jgi:hypothetical protein
MREPNQRARAERPVGAATRKSKDGDGFTSSQILRSPRHAVHGDIREAMIRTHHPYAARQFGPGCR